MGFPSKQMMNDEHSEKSEWMRSVLDRHEGPLLRYATRITGDLERARDAVQDTFVRLCAENRAKVDGHVAEWLFTVCRNRALDIQRKERRMKPMSETELEACVSQDPSPLADAERHESVSQVLRVVNTLPKNQQEVIRLKFQNGLSYKEISRITKLTVTNVGFLIHTAIKTIRQKLEPEMGLVPKS